MTDHEAYTGDTVRLDRRTRNLAYDDGRSHLWLEQTLGDPPAPAAPPEPTSSDMVGQLLGRFCGALLRGLSMHIEHLSRERPPTRRNTRDGIPAGLELQLGSYTPYDEEQEPARITPYHLASRAELAERHATAWNAPGTRDYYHAPEQQMAMPEEIPPPSVAILIDNLQPGQRFQITVERMPDEIPPPPPRYIDA